MDQNIYGRAKQGRERIHSHKPEVEQGAMGFLVSPFQGTQGPAENTPGRFVLREPIAPLGTTDYIVAAAPR